MTFLHHTRLASAFDAADGRIRSSLRKKYAPGSATDAELVATLVDADHIRARYNSLTPEARAVLVERLLGPPIIPLLPIDDRAIETQLLSAALVFRDTRRDAPGGLVTPIEVRTALLRFSGPDQALLASLLAERSAEDLNALAELHEVGIDEIGDTFGTAVAVAEAILDESRLHNLWSSLHPAAQGLVVWLAEQERALPEAEVIAYAERLAQNAPDSGRPDRIPLRVGLVQSHENDDGTVLIVPNDLFASLFMILEEELVERCGTAWDLMRDHGRPALRDSLARGAGGDPLHVFRFRLVLAIAADTRHDDAIDNILCNFDILDPEQNDLGKQASLHLDVSTPDAFARQVLLSWLHLQRDPYTSRLLRAIGVDLDAVMEALAVDASAEPDAANAAQQHRAWEHLFYLRATLVLLIGVLPETTWHRVDDLARTFVHCVRRISAQFGSLLSMPAVATSPRPPRAMVELDESSVPALTEAILAVMRQLLEPIGAVRVHPSGHVFTTNSEALRIIDDGSPMPSDALAMVESFIGDDAGAWLPPPTELGIRPSGLCQMQFMANGSLAVQAGAHVHDLVRIAQWAHPVFDADRIVFVFSETTVERSDTFDADPEEFLTWLTIRTTGEVPGRVRALFPIDSSAVDLGRRSALNAAKRRVQQLVRRLGQWGERPPLAFVEEIRGWGPAAAEVLRDLCVELVRKQAWDRPMLRHAVILLGELGDVAALPSLLRCVAYCDEPELEAAAGMACARLGEPACDGLLALFGNDGAEPEKRLISANALAALCVLQPHLGDRIASAFTAVIENSSELEPDIATIIALNLAETGHPVGADIVERVRDSQMWAPDVIPPEDAQWVIEIAPCAWGHHVYGVPLVSLYPDPAESERLSDDLGIRRIIEESGVSGGRLQAAVTGVPRRRKRDG